MNAGVLFVGGTRSGKSLMAQRWSENQASERLFLATCLVSDDEMAKRVARHKKMRGNGWQCIEEGIDPVSALQSYLLTKKYGQKESGVVLLDCISLWIANLLHEGVDEDSILARVIALADFFAGKTMNNSQAITMPYAIVGSETGLGIVPATPLGRLYRDINGQANQILAEKCSSVVFVSCGLPLVLKGNVSGF